MSQVQRGGEHQIQAGRDIVQFIHEGPSLEVVKEIIESREALLRKEFTEEARDLLDDRIGRLETKLLSRFSEAPQTLSTFSDPDFQFNILEAQRSAARSDSEDDLDLLVDLLRQRAEHPATPRLKMATRKALDIVGQLDEPTLRSLTLTWYLLGLSPIRNDLQSFLPALDAQLAPLTDAGLQNDKKWLTDLDLMGCIQLGLGGFATLKNFPSLVAEAKCPGFTCSGLSHDDADLLRKNLSKFDTRLIGLIVPNEASPDRDRLVGKDEMEFRRIVWLNAPAHLRTSAAFNALLDEAVEKNNYTSRVIDDAEMRTRFGAFERLAKLDDWWADDFPIISVTPVGLVLAYAFLKKTSPELRIPTLGSLL